MAQAATQTMPITGKTNQDEARAQQRRCGRTSGAAESGKGDPDPVQVHLQRAARKRLRAEADRGARDRDHQPRDDRYRRQPARLKRSARFFLAFDSLLKHSSARPEPGALFFVRAVRSAGTGEQNMAIKTISELDIAGRRVFIRVDFNVPLNADRRGRRTTRASARACRPSSYAIEKGARVVLASHLGRPKGKPDKKYSLEPVAARLAELLGADVALTDEPVGDGARKVVNDLHAGAVALLENLRFSPGEEANDEALRARARQLHRRLRQRRVRHRPPRARVDRRHHEVRRRQGHRPADGARGEVPRPAARRGRAPVRRHHRRRQGLRQDRRAREPARPRRPAADRRRDGQHLPQGQGRQARPLAGRGRQAARSRAPS